MNTNFIYMTHEDHLAKMQAKDIGFYAAADDFDEEIVARIVRAMETKSNVWKLADWVTDDGTPIVTTGGPNRYGKKALVLVDLPVLKDDDLEDDSDEEDEDESEDDEDSEDEG